MTRRRENEKGKKQEEDGKWILEKKNYSGRNYWGE